MVATARTDEFGIPTASSGSTDSLVGYTGEALDGAGLVYLRARHYDPAIGRFLTRDTWTGDPLAGQTQNRYSYVANDPLSSTDPSGHCGVDAALDVAFIGVSAGILVSGPEKDRFTNSLALGADIVGLVIPCATGLGMLVRGGRAVDHVGDALDGLRLACSFTAETVVATPDGPVPISQIEVGDLVLAWDEATGELVERPVIAVLPHPDDEIAELTIDGQAITTTPDHPFFTVERGWVEAGDLRPGDHVQRVSGSGVVESVTTAPYSGILWDLTVEGAHTFHVGAGQWLVHNCAAPLGLGSTGRSAPETLGEQLMKERVVNDPSSGEVIQNITMGDHRWPASDGWVKMKDTSPAGIEVHWTYNPRTGEWDDFKFK